MAQRKRGPKTARFSKLPHALLECPDYTKLSGNAIKLLIELLKQYNGFNNGDLSPSFTLMSKRGFKSKTTLYNKIKELLTADLIIVTRTGGKNKAQLYALTWIPIDECQNKHLELPASVQPLRNLAIERQLGWKKQNPKSNNHTK